MFWCCAVVHSENVQNISADEHTPGPLHGELDGAPTILFEEAAQVGVSEGPEPFVVSLQRNNLETLWGLAAENSSSMLLQVCGTVDGTPAGDYNARAPLDRRMEEGDYIVALNGRPFDQLSAKEDEEAEGGGGDAKQGAPRVKLLAKEMSRCLEVQITVQKPHLFEVTLHRQGESIGLDLTWSGKGRNLLVKEILDGVIQRCALEVQVGDSITEVNHRGGLHKELLRMLQEEGDPLTLTLSRCPGIGTSPAMVA